MEHARRRRIPAETASALARAATVLVLGLAAAAFAWYRLGPTARGTAWAEDGGLFLRERLQYGVDGTLLRPYAGYLHLLPRLVVDVAVTRPVEQYALTVSALSCLLAGGVVAAVFVLARDIVRPWPVRLVLAVVPVVLPIAPFEVSGNAANLHWYVLVLAPWLFAYRPRTWWGAVGTALLAVPVVLTEVQTVLFLPLLVLAWWRRPDADGRRVRRYALPVTVVALAASAAQVVVAMTTPRASQRGHPAVADVAAGYLLQPFAGAWDARLGRVGESVARHGWWVLVVPLVAAVVVLVAGVLVAGWRSRVMVVALAAGSVVVWVAALLANASADGRWGSLDAAGLAGQEPRRYAAASGMLLVMAVLVAASVLVGRAVPSGRTGGAARLVASAVGWCVVASVVAAAVGGAAPGPSQRADGPLWAPQVTAQVDACRADPGRTIEVRTAPWSAQVPCALVLRSR